MNRIVPHRMDRHWLEMSQLLEKIKRTFAYRAAKLDAERTLSPHIKAAEQMKNVSEEALRTRIDFRD